MAHINLLPWREELRKERQRQFTVISIGSMVLAGLIVLAVHVNMAARIEAQDSRNRFLQQQITAVEKRIREIDELEAAKKRLIARMEVIQSLQSSRSEVVHLFEEVIRAVPDGVYLTGLKQSGKALSLSGMAQSNARVSAFMRRLDGSDWLANPRLEVIKAQGRGEKISSFSLRVDQVSPKKDEES